MLAVCVRRYDAGHIWKTPPNVIETRFECCSLAAVSLMMQDNRSVGALECLERLITFWTASVVDDDDHGGELESAQIIYQSDER